MEIKIGIWKRKSQKGNTYCAGKFNLNGKDYFITLFNNDKKGNEKAPDFQMFIRDSAISQEKGKVVEIPPKNAEKEDNLTTDDVFADFGDKIDMTDDSLLPF